MNPWTQDEVQQTLMEVARRATVDPQFRALALSDSAAAMAQVNPKPLPPDVSILFVDNSGSTKIVPLPDPVQGIVEERVELMAGAAPTNMIFIGFTDTNVQQEPQKESETEAKLVAA